MSDPGKTMKTLGMQSLGHTDHGSAELEQSEESDGCSNYSSFSEASDEDEPEMREKHRVAYKWVVPLVLTPTHSNMLKQVNEEEYGEIVSEIVQAQNKGLFPTKTGKRSYEMPNTQGKIVGVFRVHEEKTQMQKIVGRMKRMFLPAQRYPQMASEHVRAEAFSTLNTHLQLHVVAWTRCETLAGFFGPTQTQRTGALEVRYSVLEERRIFEREASLLSEQQVEDLFCSFERIFVLDYLLDHRRESSDYLVHFERADRQPVFYNKENGLETKTARLFATNNTSKRSFSRNAYGSDRYGFLDRKFTSQLQKHLLPLIYPFGGSDESNWHSVTRTLLKTFQNESVFKVGLFEKWQCEFRGRLFSLLQCLEEGKRLSSLFKIKKHSISSLDRDQAQRADIPVLQYSRPSLVEQNGWIDSRHSKTAWLGQHRKKRKFIIR